LERGEGKKRRFENNFSLALSLRKGLREKEGVKVTSTVSNQTTVKYISKEKALAYFVPCWLGFFWFNLIDC